MSLPSKVIFPEVGLSSSAGSGSGFIISSDGLAVTNNHVVTGAATLEVFIGGDTTKGYNAKVVGVSECNDLAVIDIDAPGDLPRFDWYDGAVKAGLDVYAAGFPLGDPEFTLTKGIVAKAKAGGDLTGTSSIDHTIEHDANIQPGNSGGPLVNDEGQVVAVNYAGGAEATTTAQFYGIASDLAQPVVERLRDGSYESLGINGWAVYDEAAGISGIWVAGVAPGVVVLMAGLLVYGAGTGTWDVAMNVEAAAVEQRLSRPIMSRFHAGFSLGTVAGALVGALAAEPDPPTTVREPSAAADQHVADSLTGLLEPGLRVAPRIADLGAGAGFPGLVLAAALPAAGGCHSGATARSRPTA